MTPTPLRTAIALTLATLCADAQVAPVAPYHGQFSEGFETQPAQSSVSCVVDRIFEDQADLCATAAVSLVATGTGPGPTVPSPHGGQRMFLSKFGATLTFDQPIRRFGGYFGGQYGTAHFLDNEGGLVAAAMIDTDCGTGGCSWAWNGWEISSGTTVQRIELYGLSSSVGPFQLDDLEVDFAPPPAAAVNYCTAGTSALGCHAQLSAAGTPSATASSGFVVTASGVDGPTTGTFFFGVQGRQAQPWGNGTSLQCVVPPVMRGGVLRSLSSTVTCSDQLLQDLNTRWCPTCPKPGQNPGAGAVVQAQLWYRDPLSTSNRTTSLSDAIEFVVAP